MTRLAFLLPGPLDRLTGGTLYDRRMVEGLSALGWDVIVHNLSLRFPAPDSAALAELDAILSNLPDGSAVVIDGLAFGAAPDSAARHGRRLCLIALVHHPLALETGLAAPDVTRLRYSEREALRHCGGVIVTSTATAKCLQQEYAVPAEKLYIVLPGTDPASPAQGSESAAPRLLTVANATPRKGLDDLIAALIDHRDQPWHWTLIGSLTLDVAHARHLQDRITDAGLSDRCQLLGAIPAADLAQHYRTADLFILPSHHEGYGMALAEALAHGLPILSTLAGAIPATVPADAALLVPAGNRSELSNALGCLLKDPALRRMLARRAYAAGQNLPDWPRSVALFARACHQVAHR